MSMLGLIHHHFRASGEPFKHRFRRESLYSTPWGLEGDGFKDYSALYWIGEAETELLISNAMRAADIMANGRRGGASSRNASGRKLSDEMIEQQVADAFMRILEREPSDEEAARYESFMKQNVEKLGREKGIQTTLASLLLHPKALFRFELGKGDPDKHGRVRLAPGELAYAIAYTLTDKSPDDALRKAVSDDSLSGADGIREQVTRILNQQLGELDQSQEQFVGYSGRRNLPILRFFQEYFGYTKAPLVFKDMATKRKAKISGGKPEYLVSDTNNLIIHILGRDRDVLRELLTTTESFVSSGSGMTYWLKSKKQLADRAKRQGRTVTNSPFDDRRNKTYEHYNFDPEQWTEDMPLPLDKTQRAGILTQPSWLIAHSTNFENHAVHRGKWIRERLLGGTIPNTPITVDAQLPDDETMTLRERMHVTREAFCWKCHQQMDPLGLAFEMYDHFGRFRETELDKPVDSTGDVQFTGDVKMEGPVDGAVELMQKLASSRRVQQVFVRHTFRFFMGRNETLDDAPTLITADQAFTESGGSMKTLVASLLSSDSFVYRTPIRQEQVGRIANPSESKNKHPRRINNLSTNKHGDQP